MERYEQDIARASKFMEDLSLYEPCQDGLYSGRGCSGSRRELLEDAQLAIAAHMTAEPRGKKMNGTVGPPGDAHPAAPSGKVYQAAAAPQSRSLNGGSRGGGPEPGCCEEGLCTRSEVALPCYGGFADKGRRYSSESARHSAGSAYEGVYVPKPAGSYPGPPSSRAHAGPEGRYNAASPRASLAASCQEQLSRFSSPRSSLGSSGAPGYEKFSSPRASLVVPGQEKYSSPRASLVQYEGGALSPRSSYASTASDTSKHSSPRASLTSYDCGSKPSSNRTSGISMGYDQRHVSPRSSTASPRSSYSDSRYGLPGNPELDGAAGPGLPMVSPRSSLCSQDGRTGAVGSCNPSVVSPRSSISSHSSRSSRGSMSAYPELQLPSPRSSMLGPGLQEENPTQEHGDAYPRHEQQQHPAASNPDSASGALASYTYSPTKGSASAPKFKLPYQVTPSRESGPSQAERRLEALTLELEKELEMHMKKEYFGICIKCGKGVYGASQACQAMGNLYHTNCFTCCSCGRRLRGKAFYNVNGKVYCEEDFLYSGFQQTADKCFVCGHLIMEMILQALGKSYHPGCFRCVVCNECLDGVPFTVDVENNIYCVKDYHTVFAPKCASCNQPILPAQGSEETIRVVSMDRDYHVECYHCEDCGLQLNDEEGHRCYPLEGHLLCHGCHIRRLNIKVPPHPPPSYPMHVTEL
ncbi:Wilms tumor protein 1-interacting protein [Gopherus flavomarginatus]|uniref:Wilms tumor protein 1-interacting protein n=1 Tax=Gopherus flavomarginatus TaxID=286002 RepID=UPI0021CB9F9F|nr:Wilms tumor protein 1-interacting protein [Gopherus flavomarginatus]